MAFSSVLKIIIINLLGNFPALRIIESLDLYLGFGSKCNSAGSVPKKKESMMPSVESSLGILDGVNAEYCLAPKEWKNSEIFPVCSLNLESES